MTFKTIFGKTIFGRTIFGTGFAAGALLASTSAFAQAPGTEQTTQDLVCQLSAKCADEAATPADEAEAAATGSSADKAAPRISATRGFKIARKTDGSNAQASTGSSGQRLTKPAAKSSTNPVKKAQVAAPGKVKSAAGKAMPLGRADLRVTFVTGSADLTEAGQLSAEKFAAALTSPLLDGMRFTIEGHTDSVGTRESNIDLSRRRAQSVIDYLAGKGANRARFDAVGFGFDKPVAGLSAKAAANRRVEVVRIR